MTHNNMERETGRQIHVVTQSKQITAFVETDREGMICFRCGERGHARYQCLTYKVRLCWHHQEETGCSDSNCTFAHGIEELRQPWKQRCIRVVKQGGKLVCIGCNSDEHTFRKCPIHRDLMFL